MLNFQIAILLIIAGLTQGCVSTQKYLAESDIKVPMLELSRNPSSFNNEDDLKVLNSYFASENYINRAIKTKKLADHLLKLNKERFHPRQFVLEKFVNDINTEIEYFYLAERNIDNLKPSWLPSKDSYDYFNKLTSIEKIIQSGKVMNQIDHFVSSSKIIEEDTYENNFYLKLLRQALLQIEEDYLKIRQLSTSQQRISVLGYSRKISEIARLHLPQFFDSNDKINFKRVDQYFLKLPLVTSLPQASAMVKGPEFSFVKSTLTNSQIALESDIDGFDSVKKIKMATLLGLETIKFLYINLN